MPKLADAPTRPKVVLPPISEICTGEKVRVSYSELATFRDCPLKWQLKYAYRLEGPERPLRLDRGTAWHSMLQAHYEAIQAGCGKAETRAAVLQALNDYDVLIGGMERGEFETLTWMYDDYVRIYRSDHEYEVVRAEESFEFPMPVEGAPGLVIVGRIDLETVSRESGHRQVWDHKSASGRDVSKDGFLSEMLLEDQFLLYAKAKQLAGTPVHSVVYNVARTDKLKRAMLDTERYNRVKIPYSDAALDVVWEDNRRAAEALVGMWNNPDTVYSVPNPKQCGWKCDFQRAHIEARHSGRNVAEVAVDYGFRLKPRSDQPVELAEEENAELDQW